MSFAQTGIRSLSHEAKEEPLGLLCVAGFLLLLCASSYSRADELTLKNGTVLTGIPFQAASLNSSSGTGKGGSYSYWVVDDGVRRFFAHRLLVAGHQESATLNSNVSFQLKHEKTARTSGFTNIGGFAKVEPFDEFGRRTVVLPTQKGMVPIIQGISAIRPDYSTIESLTHVWDYSVDTVTIPPQILRSIIHKTSNRDDPAELKAAVLFYLQAQMYNDAQEEVRYLARRFPEMADWCQEYQRLVGDFIARKAINEIERRRDAGQHQLAYQYSRELPDKDVSADVRQIAIDVGEQYEKAIADRDRILLQLDVLQAGLPEEKFLRLKSMRASLREELHYENMSRLEPFLRVEEDETLPDDQKLALAYSGWILGDAGAVLNLDEAIRLWDSRFLILEYLRIQGDPARDQEIIQQLESTEGLGVARAAEMLERIPLPFEPPSLSPGEVREIEISAEPDAYAVKYSIMLPPEYSPAHRYPLLVVLRGAGATHESAIRWWGGSPEQPGWAMRRGYIVIAPHYCPDDAGSYDMESQAHEAVVNSIHHARKRFRIDSDRVFLAGHGMGGEACFDIGMAHPDLFAGVIPISAICPDPCRPCWRNGAQLAWYVVSGQKDRNVLEKNAPILSDMMKHGQNVIYCEYKDRGYESFFEEEERIFAWMQNLRRAPLKTTTEFEALSLKPANSQYYWLQAKQLVDRPIGPNGRPRPAKFEGNIAPGGGIYLTIPGKSATVWLSPETFDFTKRCSVRVNLKNVMNDFIKTSMEALLSDVRERGDRERLYWARLDL